MFKKFKEDLKIDGVEWENLDYEKKRLVVLVVLMLLIGIITGIINILFAKNIILKLVGFVLFGLILASVKVSKNK